MQILLEKFLKSKMETLAPARRKRVTAEAGGWGCDMKLGWVSPTRGAAAGSWAIGSPGFSKSFENSLWRSSCAKTKAHSKTSDVFAVGNCCFLDSFPVCPCILQMPEACTWMLTSVVAKIIILLWNFTISGSLALFFDSCNFWSFIKQLFWKEIGWVWMGLSACKGGGFTFIFTFALNEQCLIQTIQKRKTLLKDSH